MSDVEFEGLELAPDESAIDDAFADAFRRAEGSDTEAQTDEVTPGEEPAAEEEGQHRDELGRFARAEEGEEEQQEGEDPVLAEFLSKYDGDPEKALKAAAHQANLLGRQGDELGQLRSELQQLREGLQTSQVQQPVVPITAEMVEALDNLTVENPQAALARAGQLDQTGQLVERVMDIWFSVNPRQASAFQASLIAQQTEQRVRAEVEPLLATSSATAEEQAWAESWNLAAQQRQGLQDLAEGVQAVLEERPSLVKAMLDPNTTLEERAELFLIASDVAAGRQGSALDSQAREEAERQRAEQVRNIKTGASVVKPSAIGSLPGEGGEREQTEEDRIKSGILGARDSSILSGLTSD